MIPARMGSSRFPGKPLAPILGRPMIEHVYKRTAMSRALSEVYIATCDREIHDAARAFGAPVIMTSAVHERASDRIAEAAANGIDADIVVMVQGDEPMTYPEMIDQSLAPFEKDINLRCVNLTRRITSEDEFINPATIKVVMDAKGDALYMSRQPIPDRPKNNFNAINAYKQVCIMPFRNDFLQLFSSLEPTPLEIAESIDMMRFLEHGYPVRMIETELDTQAVDTLEDLNRVEDLMRNDNLLTQY